MDDKKEDGLTKRFCVSFTDSQAAAMEELARRNGVSVSWIVRYAVGEFIEALRDKQLRLDFRSTGKR